MTPWLFSEEKKKKSKENSDMEMRSTFHLKFHMHYFKATLFQYGKNQKILMGLMMLFRKREIKPTKKQKDVAHVVILIESHLYFINRKRSASAVFTSLIVTGKRKAGSQTSRWPKSKSTSWSHEWFVNQVQQQRWSQQSSSALTSPAPLSPAGS